MKFFKTLQNHGVLNNTIILFGADHGTRADFKYFDTKAGSYESRLPLHYIILPESFRQKYKSAFSALTFNANHRLTSQYDLYRTLQSILHREYIPGTGQIQSDSKYGSTLFRVVSASRTCEQAGVVDHFCACGSQVPISNNDPRALKAGQLLIDGINTILEGTNGKCVVYKKFIVTSAHLVLPSNDIMLTIKTRPERALLRSTIRLSGGNITLFGIERVDAYAGVSDCVSGHEGKESLENGMVRKVVACICKDQAYKVMEQ